MKKAVALALLLLLCTAAGASQITGKVVGVADGDTITVLVDKKQIRVRLYGIDAPEMGQDFGRRSKQFAADMVHGQTVTLRVRDTDRYGRTVAEVMLGDRSLNGSLVAAGLAWVYTRYCNRPECIFWNRFQEKAKAEGIGLWAHPNPIPPWEFRRTGGRTGDTSGSGNYRGNTSSKVFHASSCKHFNCKNCTAVFISRDAAIKAGYRPCSVCKP